MTTGEAAADLGISVGRVLHLIKAGRLKATKHGRDWWIEPRDLGAVRDRPMGYHGWSEASKRRRSQGMSPEHKQAITDGMKRRWAERPLRPRQQPKPDEPAEGAA